VGWCSSLLLVEGAAHAARTTVENVGVNHGRGHVSVSEKLLNGSDVVTTFEEVGREGMSHGVRARRLGDPGLAHSVLHRSLDHGLVKVVTAKLAGLASPIETRRREDPLPRPLPRGTRVLYLERIGQLYAARPSLEILLVQSPSSLDVTGKWLFELGGEKRHSVLPSLTVTDRDLVSG